MAEKKHWYRLFTRGTGISSELVGTYCKELKTEAEALAEKETGLREWFRINPQTWELVR